MVSQMSGREIRWVSSARLRDTLAANAGIGIAATAPVDEEFLLDSLALTWMLYVLKEEYGLDPDPEDSRLFGVTTIERVADYVNELKGLSDGGRRNG